MASSIKDGANGFRTPEQNPSSSSRSSPSRVNKQKERDAASETSSAHSGENLDRRDIDILAQVLSTRSEEYRLLFRLPPGEVLVQDFNCALQENILLQGHMYLFIHHICFYSNIFGFESKKTISFHEITCVRKAKTAAIFHNAIEIMAGTKKHFFGSFLSRDEAYRLIIDGWAQHNSEVKALLECQESTSDNNSQDAVVSLERENGSIQRTNGSNCAESGSTRISEICENGGSNGDCSHLEESPAWQVEDVDAPAVPEYFSKVAEERFEVGLEDFYNLFFSDAAAEFLETFHKTCGDKDFQCSRWRHHDVSGHARDLSFQHPIKIYFGAKFGNCRELQKFHAYQNSHFVIEVSQQISDVPYGDYFHVQGIWDVEGVNSENACVLRVYANVAFSRKTMFKGKIEQSTRDEYQEVSGIWIKNAQELLKLKNLGKPQEINGHTPSITHDHDVGLRSSQIVENSEGNHVAGSNRESSDMLEPQNCNPFQEGPSFATSFATSFQKKLANIQSHIKRQTHISPVWVVFFLSIVILMQLSIIGLLIRTPEVHLINERSYMNGLNRHRPEIIALLEKRVYYLNEEMLMIENHLEQMQNEYKLLKAHLHAFQRSKCKA